MNTVFPIQKDLLQTDVLVWQQVSIYQYPHGKQLAVICFFSWGTLSCGTEGGHMGRGHLEQHTNKVNAWVVPGMDRWMCRASGKKFVVRLKTCPTWLSGGYIWGHNPHLDFLDAR